MILTLYSDSAGEWRWAFAAGNGRTLAVSSEGYVNRDDALHGAALTLRMTDFERLIRSADVIQRRDVKTVTLYRGDENPEPVRLRVRDNGEDEPATTWATP